MKFNNGDRVHVTRINASNVDFFTTLQYANLPGLYQMIDSTDSNYNGSFLWKSNQRDFGPDKKCYYTLATDENKGLRWSDGSSAEGTPVMYDEEDSEEPVIQRINDMNNAVPNHYKADIDVIEFCRQHFTDEEFKGAMKFNLIKYPTRLGRKDDMVKELDKIIDYAQRYKEVLESGTT